MKHYFLAAACVTGLALSGGAALAQSSVSGASAGTCATCGASTAPVSHFFNRLAFWKSGSCSTCGHHHAGLRSLTNNAAGLPRGGSGGAAAFNPYPQGTPGTLVFPQHPFVRSPRDYFMTEPR